MQEKMKDSKNLLDLYLRKVKKKELPKPDTEVYLKRKESQKKLEETIEKHQLTLEEAEAPIYKAKLESLGLSPEEFMDLLKKERDANKKFYKSAGTAYREHMWQEAMPAHVDYDFINPLCKNINVQVCKERVCIDQPVPMNVDDIWLSSGSDGSFNRVGNNGFTAEDSVAGSSSWNWTYHRHGQTHDGQINIWASTELVEPAAVHGVGIIFEHLLKPNGYPEWNGGCAHGKDPFGLPPSWGKAKMYFEINLKYRLPNSGWTNWFDGARIKYYDLGPVDSNIACWVDNVLGQSGRRDILVTRNAQLPAGTQLLLEAYLSYWIKGLGEEGSANVYYNLNVMPYVNIEACSWEFPEWMCIHVPDYLP